jgi:cobalt/nickel transport system permease protein
MMHVDTFDQYQFRESAIHRLDPRVKVVVTISFILSNVLLPDGAWLAFAAAWLLLLLATLLARLTPGYTLKRSLLALPFVLVAVTIMFTLPGRPLLALQLGPWLLTPTDAGLLRFASIATRSWLSVQMAVLLVATTSFPDVMHALRHLRMPALLVAIISFTYRYLFVLVDESLRLMRARDARSARLPDRRWGGSLLWRARVTGNMAGQLFLRSYDRSDRVYQAMLARGYRGHFLTLNPHQMRATDWLAMALIALWFFIIQLVGRW